MLCWLAGSVVIARSRRSGRPEDELQARQGLRPTVALEHAALVVTALSGMALMGLSGLALGQHRWLDLKLGLTVFLVLPIEAMHAWVNHVWIARGLRQSPAPPFSRDLERGIGMDDMVRTLSAVLLGVALPLLFWLSVAEPFSRFSASGGAPVPTGGPAGSWRP